MRTDLGFWQPCAGLRLCRALVQSAAIGRAAGFARRVLFAIGVVAVYIADMRSPRIANDEV